MRLAYKYPHTKGGLIGEKQNLILLGILPRACHLEAKLCQGSHRTQVVNASELDRGLGSSTLGLLRSASKTRKVLSTLYFTEAKYYLGAWKGDSSTAPSLNILT
jgi:hypothetical protein